MVSGGEVKRVNAKFFLTVRDAQADTTRALNQVAVVEVTEEEGGTENAQFGAMALARNFMMQLTLAVRMYAAAEERAHKGRIGSKTHGGKKGNALMEAVVIIGTTLFLVVFTYRGIRRGLRNMLR